MGKKVSNPSPTTKRPAPPPPPPPVHQRSSKTMKAELLRADGTREDIELINDDALLKTLQEYVGGYIERVNLGDRDLVVNEEGLIHGLPVNETATLLVNPNLGPVRLMPIVGDVVLLEGTLNDLERE